MSDVEEPAAKISKLEELVEGEEMDNGQEEWLSEEILTDDDYNPTGEHDQSDSNANTSQEEGNNDSMDLGIQDTTNATGENIEQTLNNLENATSTNQGELPEELGAFLVRKTDNLVVNKQQVVKEAESDMDESIKQSEDDGNDTDELLRMLGEDNSKKKEVNLELEKVTHSSDEDNDEYIFEGAKVTRMKISKDFNNENNAMKLKVATGAYIQKHVPSRAVPEDTSDREADNDVSSKVSMLSNLKLVKSESKESVRGRKVVTKIVSEELSDVDDDIDSLLSSDEAMTVKRMFGVRQKFVTAGSRGPGSRRGINAVKTITKRVVSIDAKSVPNISPPKATAKTTVKLASKPNVPHPLKALSKSPTKPSSMHIAKREDSSRGNADDEDSQDMDFETEQGGQRLMRPERMDEEVPSDAESQSDEDSFYDEMPSSDSEDADDWFTLDIRAERAGDYIPLLGEDAKALLTAEQDRAAARLGALRRSATALVAGRRSLAAQLRAARSSLAQLDAALAQ